MEKDKEAWKKAEEYLTQLQDDEHMLTLEDTEVAIKRAEQYLHRNDGEGAAVKDKVAFKADIGDSEDPDAKFAAMEKKIQALQAQLREIHQEQSAAATVHQCRRKLCLY